MKKEIGLKDKVIQSNSLLAVFTALVLLLAIIWKAVQPNVILPELNIPGMAALSLLVLLAEYYLGAAISEAEFKPVLLKSLLAAATFGVLPWAAGLISSTEIWKLAIGGGITFGLLNWIFHSMIRRMELTISSRFTAVPAAFILYLACQGFMGIFI